MSINRFGKLAVSTLLLALAIGVAQASAAGSPTVLRFYDAPGQVTGVGFDASNPDRKSVV